MIKRTLHGRLEIRNFSSRVEKISSLYITFALLDCVRYNQDFVESRFVISRSCSIHFISHTFVTAHGRSNISLRRKGICRENDKQP